MGIVAVKAHS